MGRLLKRLQPSARVYRLEIGLLLSMVSVSRWSEWVDHIVDSPGRTMEFEVPQGGTGAYLTAVADRVITEGVEIGRLGVLRSRRRFSTGHLMPLALGASKRGT